MVFRRLFEGVVLIEIGFREYDVIRVGYERNFITIEDFQGFRHHSFSVCFRKIGNQSIGSASSAQPNTAVPRAAMSNDHDFLGQIHVLYRSRTAYRECVGHD